MSGRANIDTFLLARIARAEAAFDADREQAILREQARQELRSAEWIYARIEGEKRARLSGSDSPRVAKLRAAIAKAKGGAL